MSKLIQLVTETNLKPYKSNTTKRSNSNIGLGKIQNGPFLPIQSGNYSIDVIKTNDFKSFKVIGHY